MASRKIQAPRISSHLEREDAFTSAQNGNIKHLASMLEAGTVTVSSTEDHGATLLMAAAFGGQIHCIKMLANRGASLEAQDSLGRTALFYAVYANKREAFDVLIRRGANCFVADNDGLMPLHMAAARGCISITNKITALPTFNESMLLAVDSHGCTALHHATWRHHEDVFTNLVDLSSRYPSVKQEFINAKAEDGSTALHYSCQHSSDSDDWVEILLDEKAHRDAVDSMGRSALHYAVMRDHSESVNVLLSDAMREDELNADPKAPSALANLLMLKDKGLHRLEGEESCEGYTAVQVACVHGSCNALGIIIEAFLQLQHYPAENPSNRVDVRSVTDSEGRNILHLSAYMNHLDCIKRILSIFPDMNNSCDLKGRSSIFYCIKGMYDARSRAKSTAAVGRATDTEKGDRVENSQSIAVDCACFQYLVREVGCDTTTSDEVGRTALHYASYYNELEVTRVLLANSTTQMNTWNHADSHGQTALHMAAEKGNAASLRLLILRGVMVNAADQHGKTALHLATENGHTQCVEILLQLGADASLKDRKGRTPAHYAALLEGKSMDNGDPLVNKPLTTDTMNAVNCLRRLLAESNEAKPGLVRDIKGISPFLVAVAGGSTETARRMVEEFQELEGGVFSISPESFYDESGWSPIHYAAFHGRLSCLQLVLETFDSTAVRCDSEWSTRPMIEWQDSDGVRPIHAAAQNANTSLMGVSLLLNHGANAHVKTNTGCTVLHVAASTGHQLLCQHLISQYPDLLNQRDRNGDTAQSVAQHFGHAQLADFLDSCSSSSRRASLPPVDIPSLSSSQSQSGSPYSPKSPSDSRNNALRILVASPLSRPRKSLETEQSTFELDLGIESTSEDVVVHVSKIRPPTPLRSLKTSRLTRLPPPRQPPVSDTARKSQSSSTLPPPLKRTATPVKSLARSRLRTVGKQPEAIRPDPMTSSSPISQDTVSAPLTSTALPATPKQPELAVRTARGSSQRKTKASSATPLSSRHKNVTVTPRSAKTKSSAVSKPRTPTQQKTQKSSGSATKKTQSALSARLAYSQKLAKSGKKVTTTAATDVVVSSTMLSRRRQAREQTAAKAAEKAAEKELDSAASLPAPDMPTEESSFSSFEAFSTKATKRGMRTSAIPFSEPRARRASIVAMSKKAAVKEEVSFQSRVLKAREKGEDASELLRRSATRSRTAQENLAEFDKRNQIDKLTSTPLASSHFRDIREAAMARTADRVTACSTPSRTLVTAPSTPLFSSFQRKTKTSKVSVSADRNAMSDRRTVKGKNTSAKDTTKATPLTTRASQRPATTQRIQRKRANDEENQTTNTVHSRSMSVRKERPSTAKSSRVGSTPLTTKTAVSQRSAVRAKKDTSVSAKQSNSGDSTRKGTSQRSSSVVSRLMNDAAKRRARTAEYEKSSAAYSARTSLYATPSATGRRGRRAPTSTVH